MRTLFDLPVLRPVLALAINLLLIAIGLGAAFTLPIREYPDVDPPVVTVRTLYTGAAAEVVEREVTRVIEDQLSGISGIRLIRSTSRDESSFIQVELQAGTDLDAAAADVRDRVAASRRDLPDGIEEPAVEKASADDFATMYLTLRSDRLGTAELTDIAERRIVDALGTVSGVATVELSGGSATPCGSGWTATRWPRAASRRPMSPRDCGRRMSRSRPGGSRPGGRRSPCAPPRASAARPSSRAW
jgi:multidrug efflux pump